MFGPVLMCCPVCAVRHESPPVDLDAHDLWRAGRLPLSVALTDLEQTERDRLVDELCPDHAGDDT